MANLIYHAPGTPITFKSSGGDVTFTPTSVANAAGRISAQWNRGAGSMPGLYRWEAITKAGAALAVGAVLEIYLATAHVSSSQIDGNQSTSDAAFSAADKRRNLQVVGSIVADSTSNGEIQTASGWVLITARYVSVVWWNALGQTLSGTASDHSFTLTPYPLEIQ